MSIGAALTYTGGGFALAGYGLVVFWHFVLGVLVGLGGPYDYSVFRDWRPHAVAAIAVGLIALARFSYTRLHFGYWIVALSLVGFIAAGPGWQASGHTNHIAGELGMFLILCLAGGLLLVVDNAHHFTRTLKWPWKISLALPMLVVSCFCYSIVVGILR